MVDKTEWECIRNKILINISFLDIYENLQSPKRVVWCDLNTTLGQVKKQVAHVELDIIHNTLNELWQIFWHHTTSTSHNLKGEWAWNLL